MCTYLFNLLLLDQLIEIFRRSMRRLAICLLYYLLCISVCLCVIVHKDQTQYTLFVSTDLSV